MRSAFKVKRGQLVTPIDYSQIEQRIMRHVENSQTITMDSIYTGGTVTGRFSSRAAQWEFEPGDQVIWRSKDYGDQIATVSSRGGGYWSYNLRLRTGVRTKPHELRYAYSAPANELVPLNAVDLLGNLVRESA
jgi:hypothetical protein